MTHRVREAATPDIERVASIEKASFTDPWPADAFEPLIRAPRSLFVVAEDIRGKAVSGYSVARWVEDEAELLNIAVCEEERGQGIGALLLDYVLESLQTVGIFHIFLEVRDSNRSARALYRSRGFRELARRSAYYKKPVEDAIVLAWRR